MSPGSGGKSSSLRPCRTGTVRVSVPYTNVSVFSRTSPVRLASNFTLTEEVPLMPPEGDTEHQALSAADTPQSQLAVTVSTSVVAS